VRYFHLTSDGENELGYCLAGTRIHDRCSDQGSVLLCDDLYKAFPVIFTDGPVGAAHLPTANFNLAAEFRSRLLLSQSGMCNLRVGECHPRNQIRKPGAAARKKRVAGSLESLPSGKVRELIAAHNVARRVDVFHVGPKPIID